MWLRTVTLRSLRMKLIFPSTLWHRSSNPTTFEGQVTNSALQFLDFLKGSCKKNGSESWHFGRIFWFCMDSSPFLKREIQKNGQNPCTLNKCFGFARILCLLQLFTFARTLHENQTKFVSWPSKVVRPLDRCQRVEGKISLIMSGLEVTVLNQISQKFNFRKFLYYVALL